MKTNRILGIFLAIFLCRFAFSLDVSEEKAKRTYWRKIATPAAINGFVAESDEKMLVSTTEGLFHFSVADQKWDKEGTAKDNFLEIVHGDNGTLFALSNDRGLLRSIDGGKTWEANLLEKQDTLINARLVATDGKRTIVAAALEDENGDGTPDVTEIYLSTENGDLKTWNLVNTIPFIISNLRIADGGEKIVILQDSSAFFSNNRGNTFGQLRFLDGKPKKKEAEAQDELVVTVTTANAVRHVGFAGNHLLTLEKEVFQQNWDGSERKPFLSIPYSAVPQEFKTNQRGEVFIAPGKRPINQMMGGVPAVVAHHFFFLDLSTPTPSRWECDTEVGCQAKISSLSAIFSSPDHNVHWVSGNGELYKVGIKEQRQLELTVVGGGEVSVLNSNTGLVRPFTKTGVLEKETFGGDYDQVSFSADPKAGWEFEGWSGLPCADLKRNECALEIPSDLHVTATFVLKKPKP